MQGPEAVIAFTVVASGGAALLMVARAVAKKIAGSATGSREVEALRDDIALLRADVEGLQSRVAELDEIQNRLDFTERLLAQARERGLLQPPKER